MKTKKQLTTRILSLVLVLSLVMVVGVVPCFAAPFPKLPYSLDGGFTIPYIRANVTVSGALADPPLTDLAITYDGEETLTLTGTAHWNGEATFSTTATGFSCEKPYNAYFSTFALREINIYNIQIQIVRDAGHTNSVTVQPNCTKSGSVTWSNCVVCGTSGSKELAIDENAHLWGKWTPNGDGTHTRTCGHNSAHTERSSCDNEPATCLAASVCSICNHTYEAQKPHSYTYTADGNTITETCVNGCDHNETAKLEYATGNGTYSYTGSAITPLTVSYSDKWQGEKLNNPSYANNINAGTAKGVTTIAENGATAEQTFTITEVDISGAAVTIDPASGEYTGDPYTPAITVTLDGFGRLVEEVDYTISWDKPGLTNADSYTATITGTGNFKGTKDAVFSIDPTEIKGAVVALDENIFVYDGNAHKPKVTVTFNGAALQEGTDYELWYMSEDQVSKWENGEPIKFFGNTQSDSINAGEYYAVVYGKGNFADNGKFAYAAYTIEKKEIDISWDATMHLPYNGSSLVPKAHATNLVIGDECVLTTEVVETEDGAGIIPGNWTAKVVSLSNSNYKLPESEVRVTATFEVVNGYQNYAPDITTVNETINGKNDGKITGVDSTMEYRKDGESTYTVITGTEVTGIADGVYYVRYAAKTYYNPSPAKQVTIAAGRMLTVTVPQNQVGYTLTVDKTAIGWQEEFTLTYMLKEGYTELSDFAVEVNGSPVTLTDGKYTVTDPETDIEITVQGVADTTAPVGEIAIKENKWNSFWNNLTFGLFFKETQEVTITATDSGSGVKSIEYYLSGSEMERDELRTVTDWQPYNGTFKIDPNNRYVIYARITDNAGYVIEINSDGIVLDNIAPTLEGIEDGQTYYGNLTVIISDEQFYDIKTVTLDGVPMSFAEGTYGLVPADNAEHTVVVEDHAGNKTEYKVTVYKNYTVTYKADGEPVSTETVGHGKDATIPAVPAKDGYVGKWDSDGKNITEDTTISVIYTEIPVVKPDEVKPEDKTDLEDTKAKLEEELKDDSYTDDDKKDIQEAIDDIDDALEVIGKVEAVEELIDKLPDTIKKDDEAAIKAADDAYNALTDYEKSLVGKDAKKALDDAKKALAELNKPADKTSPDTGDNSNMFLWIALLFISGGLSVTLTVVDRKRKAVKR